MGWLTPSSARWLLPQRTVPDGTAHVRRSSAATVLAAGSPVTVTGVLRVPASAVPSWPELLYPQQRTVPPVTTAQVWLAPAETAVAPVRPGGTGEVDPGQDSCHPLPALCNTPRTVDPPPVAATVLPRRRSSAPEEETMETVAATCPTCVDDFQVGIDQVLVLWGRRFRTALVCHEACGGDVSIALDDATEVALAMAGARILNRRDTNSMLTAQALVGTKRFTVADFLSAAGGA